MPDSRTLILSAALAASALAPVTALAANVSSKPQLRGAPQMRIVDAHHAKLNFASDRLPRTSSGKLSAKITFVNGERVSGLKVNGKHGSSTKYVATVSSTRAMSEHEKFTVTFRLGKSKPVTRFVKLHQAGAHS